MTDIVERLRRWLANLTAVKEWEIYRSVNEAADEIERLRSLQLDPTSYETSIRERDAEIERLRGIEQFVSEASRHERDGLHAEIKRLTAERDTWKARAYLALGG